MKLALVLLALMLTTGCGTFEKVIGSIFGGAGSEVEVMPQELAYEGMENLKAGRYTMAIDAFQKIKDRFPYSKYAILAELKIADAYFLNEKYIEAQAAYEEFERLHPNNEAVPYVIYQQGMCHFNQMTGFDRDQTPVIKAIQTFARLQQTFPNTPYASMAVARTTEAQNSLAHHEFYVGEFYFKMGEYQAAEGRFVSLIKSYPDTGFHSQALEYIRICRELIAQKAARNQDEEKEASAPEETQPTPPVRPDDSAAPPGVPE
jgi:outer membrane protein assembly factor BamD